MANGPVLARTAEVDAKSLANMTFILNDFLISHGLDLLYVTSTSESSLCSPFTVT